jgi:hypothetical protein
MVYLMRRQEFIFFLGAVLHLGEFDRFHHSTFA